MIKFNKDIFHNFLHPYWVLLMIDAGIDVKKEARYYFDKFYNVYHIDELAEVTDDIIPTLTISDMTYMLNEWAYVKNSTGDFSGPAEMSIKGLKDAPFYIYGYYNSNKESDFNFYNGEKSLEVIGETPIVAIARLLICSTKNGIRYINNIESKFDDTNWEWENNHIDTNTWNIMKNES